MPVIAPFLRPVLIVTLTAIVFRNLEPNGADKSLDTYKNCHGLTKESLIKQHLQGAAKDARAIK